MKRAAFLLVVFAAFCGGGDPARETLDRVAKAADARDAGAVAAELAADYRDASGSGRAEIEQTLRGYFGAYEIVQVRLSDVVIERAEGAARARFRVDISSQPRQRSGLAGLLPSSVSYRFDVRLVPDRSRWKIAWASWEPAGDR
jgi:hypothetical protein